MKKILLPLAALALCTSAWAETYDKVFPAAESTESLVENGYIDVTPSGYKFHSTEIDAVDLFKTDITHGQPNLGSSKFISTNTNQGGNYFTTDNLKEGNILVGGAYNANKAAFMKGISHYDFGGEIGKVLIFNGKDSQLADAIKEKFNLSSAPDIAQMEGSVTGNIVLFWILDHITMNDKIPQGSKIRVRMELNAFYSDMTSSKAPLQMMQQQDEENNPWGPDNYQIKYSDFSTRVGDANKDQADFDKTPTNDWNPGRWMVVEYETSYNRLASYLRFFAPGAKADGHHDEAALMIRSIEVFGVPSSSTVTPNTVLTSYNTYAVQGGTTAVEVVKDAQEAVSVSTAAGTITVDAPAAVAVKVVAMNGAVVAQGTGSCTFSVAPGTYVVVTGTESHKVAVK